MYFYLWFLDFHGKQVVDSLQYTSTRIPRLVEHISYIVQVYEHDKLLVVASVHTNDCLFSL